MNARPQPAGVLLSTEVMPEDCQQDFGNHHNPNGDAVRVREAEIMGDGEKPRKRQEEGSVRLFEPMTLRGVTMRHRIWLPPMDTYSAFAQDGLPTPFHYQHYVSRAMGGSGMIIVETTAVAPEGRISPCDWDCGATIRWKHGDGSWRMPRPPVRPWPCNSTMRVARPPPVASP